jgi:transcriptional regulator with XRE-family HTH domain
MPKIGARLRAIRLARGMTLDQLADVTGLNKGSISRIENDASAPSAATLWALCAVLDVTVGSLFELPDNNLVRLGDRPIAPTAAINVEEYLLTPRRQGRLQLTHATIAPGGSGGPDLYTINCDVEVGYVLRGAIEIMFATATTIVGAGAALTFSGREPHTYANRSRTEEAEVIWVIVPAMWSTSTYSDGHSRPERPATARNSDGIRQGRRPSRLRRPEDYLTVSDVLRVLDDRHKDELLSALCGRPARDASPTDRG